MTTKLLKPVSLAQKAENERPFFGFWLRWRALSAAERLVCVIIVLMPIWWVLGIIPYLLYFIAPGVAFYEWRHNGGLGLKRPNLVVIALFTSYIYGLIVSILLFFDAHPLAALAPDTVKRPIDFVDSALSAFSFIYLVWYIQSNNVRIRLEVVAWAFSVSVLQMLAVWFVVHFVFAEAFYVPPRTLWALLTSKSTEYFRGIGDSNYLLLYWPTDSAFGGLPRFYSFFHRPEALAVFISVVGILALDIKNRLWSLLLLAASIFLLGLSGTRTFWIAFPIVVIIHFLFTTSKIGGPRLLFALIAIMSFVTLSLPPATDILFNSYTDTATYISEFRENSTKSRGAIYEGTMERILDNPVNFTFGHVVSGPLIPGTEVEIGSHSFLLGTLLYKGGLISTGLFVTYWVSLIMWLYRTRIGRPVCSFLILLLLSISFTTMLLSHVAQIAIPLSMMLRNPTMKLRRNAC